VIACASLCECDKAFGLLMEEVVSNNGTQLANEAITFVWLSSQKLEKDFNVQWYML
jgi:hypothetical protein